jgi:predicted site-specific integrase-resolvase
MPLLNVEQLEQDSGVSRYTWRSWFRQGRVPVVRLGRRVLVEEADYRRFLADNRVEAREVRRPA